MGRILTSQQVIDIRQYLIDKFGGIYSELNELLKLEAECDTEEHHIITQPLSLNLLNNHLDCQADMYLLLRSKGVISEEDASKAKAILFDIYFPSMKNFLRRMMNQGYSKYFSSQTEYGIPGDGCFYIAWETFLNVIRKIKLLRNKENHSIFLNVWIEETKRTIIQEFNESKYHLKFAIRYISEFNQIRKYAARTGVKLSELSYWPTRSALKLKQSEKVFNDFIKGIFDMKSLDQMIEAQTAESQMQCNTGTELIVQDSKDNPTKNFLFTSLLSLLCDPNTTNQEARDLVVVFDTIVDNNMNITEFDKMVKTFASECFPKNFIKVARNRGCEMIIKYAKEHYPDEYAIEKKERIS